MWGELFTDMIAAAFTSMFRFGRSDDEIAHLRSKRTDWLAGRARTSAPNRKQPIPVKRRSTP